MRLTGIAPIAVAALAGLVAAACASSARTTSSPPAEIPADSVARLEALYRARLDSARMRYTEADVRFMTAMIAHHAQAIEMSRLAPTHTDDAAMHVLAARIINAQRDEIASMQRWLRDRGQPVPEVHDDGRTLMIHGAGGHHMHAVGMLTPEQMQQLARARGREFDRLFLTYMIQHHKGAVSMVRDLFATDGAAQDEEIFKFAADVEADQSSEVARMELMLKEMSGTGGPR